MILISSKNHKVLTKQLEIVTNFKGKILGLLSKDSSEAIMFRTRFGVHTFGLKKPIDVIICDSDFKVQAFHPNLSPNNICLWNPKYNVVFELPAGTIKKSEISLGDILNVHNPGETW